MPRALLVMLAAAFVISCGSAAGGSSGPEVVASDADNGKTVNLHVGDRLVVKLASTYWTIAESSDPRVLKTSGPAVVSPQPTGCVPGAGCGFAIATFEAVAPGSAEVTASRTSCGEAMRCVGDAGFFRVSIVVTARDAAA